MIELPRDICVRLADEVSGLTLDPELLPEMVNLNDLAFSMLLALDLAPKTKPMHIGPTSPAALDYDLHPVSRIMSQMTLLNGLTYLLQRSALGDFRKSGGTYLARIIVTHAVDNLPACAAFEFSDNAANNYTIYYGRPPAPEWLGLITSHELNGYFVLQLAVEFTERARMYYDGCTLDALSGFAVWPATAPLVTFETDKLH